MNAPHIEQLPLELHGEIHNAIRQSGTPYESLVATHAFMATSRTIRGRSNFYGGSGSLDAAVRNAFNDAATATAQDGMLAMFWHGNQFEHLSPNRQATLLEIMRASDEYLFFATQALQVMSAPNFEREVTYLLGTDHLDKFGVFLTLADFPHKMTNTQLGQMVQLLRDARVGPIRKAQAINEVRFSQAWSQLNDSQRNLFDELVPAESV